MGGIGTPAQLIERFSALEEAGVDQLILLQQAGSYEHEHICESLELFAAEVLPHFQEREPAREAARQQRLEPAIERALEQMPALGTARQVEGVEAYPLLWEREGGDTSRLPPDRRPGVSALWQLQVSGRRRSADDEPDHG
jgi:hypothetical protein